MTRHLLPFLCLPLLALLVSTARADEITFYGDFEDGFGSVAGTYESGVPYVPGSVTHSFHEMVVGLSKFDPSLGVLTDIEVFVEGSSPIFYTLGGGMEVTELDDLLPEYSASMSLFGEVSLNYEGASLASTLFGDAIPLSAAGVGAPGTGSFTTPVSSSADGMLTGDASIFGAVDLSDFVGPGAVDTLFVDMFVEDTADFSVDNATAMAGLAFDVFDSDSGADDAVIGITYTFTAAVPEPGSASLLVLGFMGLAATRRRRR